MAEMQNAECEFANAIFLFSRSSLAASPPPGGGSLSPVKITPGIWVVTYLFIYLPWPGGLLIYLFFHCGLVECSFIYFLLSLILAGSSFIYSEPAPLHLGITGFHQIEGNHLFIYFSS